MTALAGRCAGPERPIVIVHLRTPIHGRRFLLVVLMVICGIGRGIWGRCYFDDSRPRLGVAFRLGRGFPSACGIGLWWLTGFSWSWGW